MNEDYLTKSEPRPKREVNNIVIHCTATQPKATIKSILDYHHNVKGWKVAGYHYIIDYNGNYERTVNIKDVSNGVQGHNADSIHIAYVGGIDKAGSPMDTRTPAQKETLIDLIRSMKRIYSDAKVLGHRDFSEDKNGNGIVDPWERIKECPCYSPIEEYKDIKWI
jgi:N-acetylmuramoyl-L-alanine amidase